MCGDRPPKMILLNTWHARNETFATSRQLFLGSKVDLSKVTLKYTFWLLPNPMGLLNFRVTRSDGSEEYDGLAMRIVREATSRLNISIE